MSKGFIPPVITNPYNCFPRFIWIKKEFTVGIADVKNMIPADYVEIVSGNDTPDKM